LFAIATFAALALTLPRWLSVVTAKHYAVGDSGRMFVAVKDGSGALPLDPLAVPATLEQEVFLANGDVPNTPEGRDAPDRVRIVGRGPAGAVMETVRSDHYAASTSRHLVNGRRITPVSQTSYGVLDEFAGALIAADVALALRVLVGRR
jgi:hypothetical protein